MLAALAVALALTAPLPPEKPASTVGDTAALSAARPPANAGPAAGPDTSQDAAGAVGAVPVPRPRPDDDGPAAAEPGREVAAIPADQPPAKAAQAASSSGEEPAAGAVPVPRPRPDGDASAVEEPASAAVAALLAAKGTTAVAAGQATSPRGADAPAVPIPAERPTAASADGDGPSTPGMPARTPGEAKLAAIGMPKPPARPQEEAPVIRAMLPVPENPAGRLPGITPRGMVCRDPRIVGAPAATVVGGIPGCGIAEPVRVESISGVRISKPALVDCRTARAFADWLTGVAQPAARETLGSELRSVSTMGSYTCRTRNNRPGQRLSEHSVGRAIDVGGMTLADGRRISVRDHWGAGAPGTFLRRAWKGACGGFTTVIGPDGDRHHYNHLHLDTAYRDSTYCR